MPPREHRRKGSACPWLPLLAVAALAIAGVQMFMHHHAQLPAALDSHSLLSPAEVLCSTNSASSSTINDAKQQLDLEAQNKALARSLAIAEAVLRDSQSRSDQLAREAAELRQRVFDSTSPTSSGHAAAALAVHSEPVAMPPPVYVSSSSAHGVLNSSVDDSYALRPSDCSVILSQRTRIANMDEDFAFIKVCGADPIK